MGVIFQNHLSDAKLAKTMFRNTIMVSLFHFSLCLEYEWILFSNRGKIWDLNVTKGLAQLMHLSSLALSTKIG